MKRINLYTLIIVTVFLLLFCLAAVNANAQEADNDESLITYLGELSMSCLPVSTSLTNA